MSTDTLAPARPSTAQLFSRFSWALAAMVALKFVALALEGSIANAPYFFLIFFCAPLVIAALLAGRRPRTAALIALPFAGWFAVWIGAIVVTGTIEPYWGDYMVVFLGGPIALLVIGTAIRLLMRR